MGALLDQALAQLDQINSFCTFCAVLEAEDTERRLRVHPAYQSMSHQAIPGIPPPEISGPDPLQRRTLDPDIWHGLGIVGVWAAIDAFRERKNRSSSSEVHNALTAHAPHLLDTWGDVCDLRHLFAHKFAGQADDYYWYYDGPGHASPRPHYHFSQGATVSLTSRTGTQFQHDSIRLTIKDLEFYVEQGRAILTALDNAWP
jgi:hypothetical protein